MALQSHCLVTVENHLKPSEPKLNYILENKNVPRRHCKIELDLFNLKELLSPTWNGDEDSYRIFWVCFHRYILLASIYMKNFVRVEIFHEPRVRSVSINYNIFLWGQV